MPTYEETLAEAKAADEALLAELGIGPAAKKLQISSESWEALSGPEQEKFISAGGTVYTLPAPPKVDPEKEFITNKRGEQMPRPQFDRLEPQERMNWCTAQ